MKTSTFVWIIAIIIVIIGGWYWWSSMKDVTDTSLSVEQASSTSQPSQNTTAGTATQATSAPNNLLLSATTTGSLGRFLVASNGMTLYKYTQDLAGVSNCSGDCAIDWPPYTVASTDALANIQAGVTGKVATIVRTDGTMQVTYNDTPLYFWANDKNPGDATGQNVGGVWFVVTP